MYKNTIRLRKSDLNKIITETVRRVLRESDGYYTMVKNLTGIEDDDILNLHVEYEEKERFKEQVWKDIMDKFGFSRLMDRKNVYNFHVIKDLLYTKHNMEYMGTEKRKEVITHIFQNDKYTLELETYEDYTRLNKFHLSRIDIYSI